MKKKSPPYALIGAALLAIIAIYAFVQYQKNESAKEAQAIAAARADAQRQIDEAKSQHVVVQETPTNLRYVLYATQPVEPGVRISSSFFEKKLTPKDILPDAYSDGGDIVGWFAIRKIEKGDPLTPRNVGKSLPFMSQRISPGMRAVSLDVYNAAYNRTGGFIVDGDKVDLLFTRNDGDFKISTQTIMQSVSVLYVPSQPIKTDKTDGINPVPPPDDRVAITFEVTPEQAQALVFLSSVKQGRFDMIMRARRDTTELNVKPFMGSDYFTTSDLRKIQKLADKSMDRVQALAAEIDAKEKSENAQATTNETATPTPPPQ